MHPPIRPDLAPGATARTTPQRRRVIDVHGNDVHRPQEEVRIQCVPGPRLVVQSGRVVASDPYLLSYDAVAYSQPVPTGQHATEAVRAEFSNGQSRVAFAVVWFTEQHPVRWRNAARGTEKLADLKEGEAFAYGVDHGTGCFADAETVALISRDIDREKGVFADLDAHLESGGGVAEAVVHPETGLNFVAFWSGWGDGVYSSFWGFDEGGEPACLVTDFDVVENDLYQEAWKGQPRDRTWLRRTLRAWRPDPE